YFSAIFLACVPFPAPGAPSMIILINIPSFYEVNICKSRLRRITPQPSFLIVQEAFVIADKHLGFNLFYSLQYNAYNDDNRCTAEGNVCSEHTVKEERNDGHNDKTYCTYKYNIIQDFSQII